MLLSGLQMPSECQSFERGEWGWYKDSGDHGRHKWHWEKQLQRKYNEYDYSFTPTIANIAFKAIKWIIRSKASNWIMVWWALNTWCKLHLIKMPNKSIGDDFLDFEAGIFGLTKITSHPWRPHIRANPLSPRPYLLLPLWQRGSHRLDTKRIYMLFTCYLFIFKKTS